MILNYGFSIIGKSHITRDVCCQDSHRILKLENGWVIAAIADGVGSAKNSQIGSKIAVDTVVDFCDKYMPWDYNSTSIKSMIRTAYNYAYKQILKESENSGESVESYDTTLSMVIYDGSKIIYGHSGDGAIIGLNTFGSFVQITTPQKTTEEGYVYPLRFGYTYWDIGEYEEELASVILVTDGMLDIFYPYKLRLIENETDDIYTPISMFFTGIEENFSRKKIENFITYDNKYDKNDFYFELLEIYKKYITKEAQEIVELIKQSDVPAYLMSNVQDDKTVVVLKNSDLNVEAKSPCFYADPNWKLIEQEWIKKAYPHLYKKNELDKKQEDILEIEKDVEELELEKNSDILFDDSNIIEQDEVPELVEQKEELEQEDEVNNTNKFLKKLFKSKK